MLWELWIKETRNNYDYQMHASLEANSKALSENLYQPKSLFASITLGPQCKTREEIVMMMSWKMANGYWKRKVTVEKIFVAASLFSIQDLLMQKIAEAQARSIDDQFKVMYKGKRIKWDKPRTFMSWKQTAPT